MDQPFRVSTSSVEQYFEHLEEMRALIAHYCMILRDNPRLDSFAGRKTQEPFPKEISKDR